MNSIHVDGLELENIDFTLSLKWPNVNSLPERALLNPKGVSNEQYRLPENYRPHDSYIVKAASKAQKASDYLLALEPVAKVA